MHRLFVAIRPPAPIRKRLLDAMGGIGGARWQSEDQLHLTLRFIGEVDRHAAADIHAALGAVHHPPFEIALHGVGTFERRGHADTVWAGIAPTAPMKALHHKVDAALALAAVPPDQRAFVPHITLARLNRAAGPVGDFLARAGTLASPPFAVDWFGLFESDLTPAGPVYSCLERYSISASNRSTSGA